MYHPVCPVSPQRCVRTAARTVDAASDPTDVPASMVSLARSAREVRGDAVSVLIQSLVIPRSRVQVFNAENKGQFIQRVISLKIIHFLKQSLTPKRK